MRCASFVLVATAVVTAAPVASAQDPGEAAAGPSVVSPPDVPGLDQAQNQPYWSHGRHRPFVSATVDAGLWYLRPTIAAGFGKPHWRWLGVEAQTRLSSDGGAEYGGLRFVLPRADLRVGGRYVFATSQAFLLPDVSHDGDELDLERASQTRYLALEGEVSASLPISVVRLFGVLGGMALTGVPEPYHVYEQSLHVVVEPPWAWRARGGLLVPVGHWKQVSVGAAAEVIGVPARDLLVTRAGPLLAISLTHHLEAHGALMLVIYSRDELGIDGAEFGQLGVRYRWATGDAFPEFP